LTTKKDSSNISSTNRIKSVIQRKRRIYFRELLKEADVSTEYLEDFLIPLLGEDKIEGKLEVHCPDCGADLGLFKKYADIPKENECETCGHSNPISDNYLEILLEVKGDFFRV
jgi:predicted RNA-binding Zn-ribbon protein involved in translation (DUF1610 family)